MKRTAYQVLQLARQAIVKALTGEGVESLDEAQLKVLMESVIKDANGGLTRYVERSYDAIIELALRHLDESQWDQARSKATEALTLKPQSRKAKLIIEVANALEETRRLLSEKLPLGAEKAFRPANQSKLKLEIVRIVGEELATSMNLHDSFNRAMTAAQEALKPGDNQNFQTARTEAQTALKTGWNNEEAQLLLELITTTETQVLVAETLQKARVALDADNLANAETAAREVLALDAENAAAKQIQSTIGMRRAIKQFIGTAITHAQGSKRDNAVAALTGALETEQTDYVIGQIGLHAPTGEPAATTFAESIRLAGEATETSVIAAHLTDALMTAFQPKIESVPAEKLPLAPAGFVPTMVEAGTLTLSFSTTQGAEVHVVATCDDLTLHEEKVTANESGVATVTFAVTTDHSPFIVSADATLGEQTSEPWWEKFNVLTSGEAANFGGEGGKEVVEAAPSGE